jgi:hypothetical protein
MASSSIGRPAAASFCMEERMASGTRSSRAMGAASSSSTASARAAATSSRATATASSQCPARTSPKGAAVQVVVRAIGASTTSLDQRTPASSSRTVTSRPVSASRAPSSSTRPRGALPAASSTTANGEACSIRPGPTRVDSTAIVPATTWSGG